MSLTLTQNYTAITPSATFAQFVAIGGSSPYTYSVLNGGAGGSINSSTGTYSPPPKITAYPATGLLDTVQVIDSTLTVATATILIGTPLFLFCDIIQTSMGLSPGRVYLWDQKIFQPTDSDLYIAVSVPSCKPFGNVNSPVATDGSRVQQFVTMYARVDLDIISRGPAARDQKEMVVLALNSIYSQQQQEANGFYIGKIPLSGGFLNLSQIDGAAIPYRYKISYAMQYQVSFGQSVPYYDSFSTPAIFTNP